MNSSVSPNVQISRNCFEALVPSRELVVQETGRNACATAQANIVFDSRLSLVRQHGTFTLAYSAAVQEGLEYFGNDHGFLAYKMVGSTALVLADPVSSDLEPRPAWPDRRHLLDQRLIGVDDGGEIRRRRAQRSMICRLVRASLLHY
jgi:hypothetical protein